MVLRRGGDDRSHGEAVDAVRRACRRWRRRGHLGRCHYRARQVGRLEEHHSVGRSSWCMYLHNRVVRPLESLLVRRLPISPSPLFPFDRPALAAAGARRLVGGGGQPAPSTGRETDVRPRPSKREMVARAAVSAAPKLKRRLTDLKRSLGHKARKRVRLPVHPSVRRPSVRWLKKGSGE